MPHRTVPRVVIVGTITFAIAHALAVAQPPHAVSVDRDSIMRRINATTQGVSEIQSRPARIAALAALCRPALLSPPLRPTTDEGWFELCQVFTWAGSQLYKADADDTALESLTALAESAAPDRYREQGWRLAGQIHMKHSRWAQAAECFERQVALCDANPSLHVAGGCTAGLNQLAVVRRMQGRSVEAIAALDKLIESRGRNTSDDSVGRALRMKAAMLADSGQAEAALATMTAFLDAEPAWGDANGERLDAIAFKARMLLRLQRPSDALSVTSSAWAAAVASQHNQTLALGREHVKALIQVGRGTEAMEARATLVDLIDRNETAWTAHRPAGPLNDERISLLCHLVEADRFERPALAENAADRLMATIPDAAVLGDLERAKSRIRNAPGLR
ncbi:MAG: hypothetical protein HBSAPP03_16020 [Phycisphaerae bacterium]|nr:MAG: hypothetical protein HBSAPP03_16020 [Phycisphaerae bacterium]